MKRIIRLGIVLGAGLVAGTAPSATRAQPAAPAPAAAPAQLPDISLDLRDAPVRQALEQVFSTARVDYSIDNNVAGFVTLKVTGIPFDQALRLMLRSANPPLTYAREGGVFIVRPRVTAATGPIDAGLATGGLGAEPAGAGPGAGPGGIPEKVTLSYADAADVAAIFGGTVITIGAVRNNGQGGGGFGGGQSGGGFGGGGGLGGGGGFGGGGGGGGGGLGGGGLGGGGFGGGGGGLGGGGGFGGGGGRTY